MIGHSIDNVVRLVNAVWVMLPGRAVANRRVAEATGEELVAPVTAAKAAEMSGPSNGNFGNRESVL